MRKNFKNIILVIVLIGLMAVSFCNVKFFQLEIGKAEFCVRIVRGKTKTNIETIIDKLNSYKKENPELKHKMEMIAFLLESDDKFVPVQGLRAMTSLPEEMIKPLVNEALNELKELLLVSEMYKVYKSQHYSDVIQTTAQWMKYVNKPEDDITRKLKAIFRHKSTLDKRLAVIDAIPALITRYEQLKVDFDKRIKPLLDTLILSLEQSGKNANISLKIASIEALIPLIKYENVSGYLKHAKVFGTINQILIKHYPEVEESLQLKLKSTAARYLLLSDNLEAWEISDIISHYIEIMENIKQNIKSDEDEVDIELVETATLEVAKLSKLLWIKSQGYPKKMGDFDLLKDEIFFLMGEAIEDSYHLHPFSEPWLKNIRLNLEQYPEEQLKIMWDNRVALFRIYKLAKKEKDIDKRIQLYSLLGQIGYKDKEILSYLAAIINSPIESERRKAAKAIVDILLSEGKFNGTKSGLEYREVNETD